MTLYRAGFAHSKAGAELVLYEQHGAWKTLVATAVEHLVCNRWFVWQAGGRWMHRTFYRQAGVMSGQVVDDLFRELEPGT